jgi:methyltransferase (TIGR00027 family)
VVAFKEQVLIATAARPGCARLALHADLREDWPARLRAAGYRDDEPTAWLAEGLLVFLGPAENDRLLGRIGVLSAPRSRLGLSVSSQALFDSLTERTTLDALGDYSTTVGSQWRSAFAVQPGHWLDAHGWRSRAYDPAERARVYGRRTADLTSPHIGGRLGWLAVAERA